MGIVIKPYVRTKLSRLGVFPHLVKVLDDSLVLYCAVTGDIRKAH
jgi:hypothetical protein